MNTTEITELEDKKMELEYKICTLSFNVMFYNELLEKFAAAKHEKLIQVIMQQQALSQKLAITFNNKLKDIDTRIQLAKSVN
jgi:hypothetical protein